MCLSGGRAQLGLLGLLNNCVLCSGTSNLGSTLPLRALNGRGAHLTVQYTCVTCFAMGVWHALPVQHIPLLTERIPFFVYSFFMWPHDEL